MDLPNSSVESIEAQNMGEKLQAKYFQVSAKDGTNVSLLFDQILLESLSKNENTLFTNQIGKPK